jgi:predicted AlkP superfamily pyrophosphatase or phosphodiesterase
MKRLSLHSLYIALIIYTILLLNISSLEPKTRVILIGIDGLLQRCLNQSNHTTIDYFMNNGAYTFRARTVIQAISAPAWTGILCGIDSEGGGVLNNYWSAPWLNTTIIKSELTPMSGEDSPMPCIFQKIKTTNPESKVSAYFSWWWFQNIDNLSIPGSIDNERFCIMSDMASSILCDNQALETTKEMISENFDFLFVYLGSLDETGHAKGFCSSEYLDRLGKLDDLTIEILSHLEKENILDSTYIILTTDHGANHMTHTHGNPNDDNLNIPWMIVGPNIKKNHEIKSSVRNYDTASTIMGIFGHKPDPYWRGKLVEEAFIDYNEWGIFLNYDEKFLSSISSISVFICVFMYYLIL